MTNYSFKSPDGTPDMRAYQEAKEKRKKQLEEVRRRRRLIYELMRKMHNR